MDTSSATYPASRQVVLVGGGHAHVEVLRRIAMHPLADVQITVVIDRTTTAYSGMVPDLIAGRIERPDLEIDVWPLARRAGATVVEARMTGLDPARRLVILQDRSPLYYDVCSLDIGGSVAGLDVPGVRQHAIATRPLARLLTDIGSREQDAEPPRSVVVVGGGAAGVELAFAMRARFPAADVTLVTASTRLMPGTAHRLHRAVMTAFSDHRIETRFGARVTEVRADAVVCGVVLPSDCTLWSTGAAPHPALAELNAERGPGGFLLTADDLRVKGLDGVFAAGDCAVPESRPDLPRAGVYAVRAGPLLANNLRALLLGRPLEDWRPQRHRLLLLNVCDGTAIGYKWGIAVRGAALYRWKDRIDRAWLDRYRGDGLPQMPTMNIACLGCAAKVPPAALRAALSGHLSGPEGEDAAFLASQPGPLAWTVDAFPAFSGDAETVARIAVSHALADLWAKGVVPSHALAIVTIPDGPAERVQATLDAVMAGLSRGLGEAGVALVGGHTLLGDSLTIGVSAVGPAPWFVSTGGAQPSDVLLLTQPLGTGVALRADMHGRMSGDDMHVVLEHMGRMDSGLVDCVDRVHAATDVSGFGLANHLLDMCRASGCRAVLALDALPVLPGVEAALKHGIVSTSAPANEAAAQGALSVPEHARRPLLFDPQTSGGLLLAVSAEDSADIAGRLGAVAIGRMERHTDGPYVVAER